MRVPSGPATVTGERACGKPLSLNPNQLGEGRWEGAGSGDPEARRPAWYERRSLREKGDPELEGDGKVLGVGRGLFYFALVGWKKDPGREGEGVSDLETCEISWDARKRDARCERREEELRVGLRLSDVVQGIKPVDQEWRNKAKKHIDNLTMPRGSLGEVLLIAERLAAIKETLKPSVTNKAIVTMAGDHGVVEEGVSAYPQEVTQQMVANFVAGGAAINVLASTVGARVIVVDMGVAADISELARQGKILSYKVDYGTKNMCRGPAMTREQAVQALEAGIDIASRLVEEGVELLGTGDMGIGNTTPSTAILAALSGVPVGEITGRGTGVDDVGLSKKVQAIKKALEVNRPDPKDGIDVLAKVGGFEIGGIAGLILGAAYHQVPVVVDGLISTAGALIAHALAPSAVEYMFAAHLSTEPGHRLMLRRLGLRPVLDLDLRLGEGTGAALAMPVIEGAARVIGEMATFEQASVSRSIKEHEPSSGIVTEHRDC